MSHLAAHFPLDVQPTNGPAHFTSTTEHLSVQSYANHASNLGFLLYGLSQSRRWVYYFSHDFKLSAPHANIMQVKYSNKSPVVMWIEKVIQANQCAAIVLEKSQAISQSIGLIKRKCEQAGMMLIVINPKQ